GRAALRAGRRRLVASRRSARRGRASDPLLSRRRACARAGLGSPRCRLKKPGSAPKRRRKSSAFPLRKTQGNFMDDRFNTIAGWVLFAGIVALGSSIVAGEYFHSERPEKMGYPIAGVQEEGAGAAAAEKPIEFYLATADPAKGQQVFNKCMACHNADKGGPNQLGPNLWDVLGQPIGQGK